MFLLTITAATLMFGIVGRGETNSAAKGKTFHEATNHVIPKEKASKKHAERQTIEGKKKTADEDKPEVTFARKMLEGIFKRKNSRRYEFRNVSDSVIKSVTDTEHTCAEGEPPVKTFSNSFRNFCWFENDCGCNEEPSMLRCFPSFHIIGFPKAGTTDLYQRLMKHPQVLPTKKETNYWSVGRFAAMGNETEKIRGENTRSLFTEVQLFHLENGSVISLGLLSYLDFYLHPLERLESAYGYAPENRRFSNIMFGEGSVTYAYSSLGLRISIGHRQKKSPMDIDCNIAKIIRWLTPKAKIIVSLRNPVDRLYSDYRNLFNLLPAANKTAADFHKRVLNRIRMWNKCTSVNSEDYCINSPQFEAVHVHSGIIGLVRSMYVLHLRKWLKEFPRYQVYVVHFEERIAEGERIIADIVKFLELEPLSSKKLDEIIQFNETTYKRGEGFRHQAGHVKEPMWESTRKILEDFYRPYNQQLAKLLDDGKYLWYDSKKQFKKTKVKST